MIQQLSVENHLPLMKERTFRQNLTQKSTIRSKSPRPELTNSLSTLSMATEHGRTSRMSRPLQVFLNSVSFRAPIEDKYFACI